MAQIRVTISGVTATRTIDDAKATAVANAIYAGVILPGWDMTKPLPVTAQDRLQALVDWLALDMRDTARTARQRELQAEHATADLAELAAIDV
jgi:hypothetical protein